MTRATARRDHEAGGEYQDDEVMTADITRCAMLRFGAAWPVGVESTAISAMTSVRTVALRSVALPAMRVILLVCSSSETLTVS